MQETNDDTRPTLETLEVRLRAMLPETYQDTYEQLEPVPMRAAGLKYDQYGDVAWDEIWQSFCDLAMAGGPPHKGSLLQPGLAADIEAHDGRYRRVAEEVCRGVEMAAGLPARLSPEPGWVAVTCASRAMAGWLLRAITMENVAVRADGSTLFLPAGPFYRIEKEIKNVVTVIAKTTHYWAGHIPPAQQQVVGCLFDEMAEDEPLITPAAPRDMAEAAALDATRAEMAASEWPLPAAPEQPYREWFGVACADIRAAIWMMRALVVSNVLARREQTVLYVPVNPPQDPGGSRVRRALTRVRRYATARGLPLRAAGPAA